MPLAELKRLRRQIALLRDQLAPSRRDALVAREIAFLRLMVDELLETV